MDNPLTSDRGKLPAIPRIETGRAGPLALIEADPARFQAIMQDGMAHYGGATLRIGDRLSRRWLADGDNPYHGEIGRVAAAAGTPGAHLLNMSYEWTCTTSVGADPSGDGARMLRTLDWPLHGLGRHVVVARHETDAGPYHNVTWPGFIGVATAMAPGRFAAALNQPPMRRWTPSCWFDWAVNRVRLWRRRALPPVHLLRHVFETCETYADARDLLSTTPLAIPAFFTLSGVEAGEGCVIEREEDRAWVRDAPASVANHWVSGTAGGRARGTDSTGRWDLMETLRDNVETGFYWLRPPILNPTTRLAVVANAATGEMLVQGWEEDGPATAVFEL